MARRIDYLDDPNAPAPNSLKPSVNVLVQDTDGRVLMIRRTDNDKWSLPGGAIDLGETVRQAAVRETLEETGIRCEISGIAGIYSNPGTLSSTPATARSARSSPSCYRVGPSPATQLQATSPLTSRGSQPPNSQITTCTRPCECGSRTI